MKTLTIIMMYPGPGGMIDENRLMPVMYLMMYPQGDTNLLLFVKEIILQDFYLITQIYVFPFLQEASQLLFKEKKTHYTLL